MSPPSSTLKLYMSLTRPPALLTAPSDALTGLAVLLALGHQLGHQLSWWQLTSPLLVSLFLYAGGMVMNDVFDATLDAQERPERPIPSGALSRAQAAQFGVALQLIALMLAYSLGLAQLLIAFSLMTCTYLYNAVLKTGPLGPLAMALCRWLNLWVGAGVLLSLQDLMSLNNISAVALLLSTLTATYVLALTATSRFEVHGGAGARWAGVSLSAVALLPFMLSLALLNDPTDTLSGWLTPLSPQKLDLALTSLASLYLYKQLAAPTLALWRAQEAHEQALASRGLVGAGVRGVSLLNAAWCAALGFWPLGLALIGLSLSAKRVARAFATT